MAEELNPAKGILALLNAATPDITTGWHFATGRLVATPDKMVVVANSGGRSPEPVIAQNYPSIQIMVRGAKGSGSYDDAYLKAIACRSALLGIPSRPAAYENLSSVTGIGDVTPLGYDDSDRPLFSVNLQLITFNETSGYREDV